MLCNIDRNLTWDTLIPGIDGSNGLDSRSFASRIDSSYRSEQCHSRAVSRGSKDYRNRLHTEFLQRGQRNDDGFIDNLAEQGIAYVPFFPLGGFTPLQSTKLDTVAASLEVAPMQVALAWLLQRSPNILLIPGTSSLAHLRENLSAATLKLSAELIADLDSIGESSNVMSSRGRA